MRSKRSGIIVVASLLATVLAGCGSPGSDDTAADGASPGDDGLLVVATTSIWGDMASRVLGDAGRVEVVMEGGQDPHSFRLSAQQLGRLGEADLVVANGLGLEAGLADALDELATSGVPVVEVASALDPIAAGEEAGDADDHDDADDGHDHGELDPHVWLDPVRMAQSAHVIAAALGEVVPGPWEGNAHQLEADLDALHGRVGDILAAIPDECRVLVANHDAMRYLAVRYDLEVGATVLPGFSTDVQPSAQDFAAVVELVADTGVPAVFVEDTASTRLADALAEELGGAVTVVSVPVASLGPAGSPTDSYEGLMTTLASRVAEALAAC